MDLRIVKSKKKALEGGLTKQASEYHAKLQREAFIAGAQWASEDPDYLRNWSPTSNLNEAKKRYP